MHICMDENSTYDESHVEWDYLKKTIIGKNQTWKETIDWLMKKYWFHLNKFIFESKYWMKLHAPWIEFQLHSNLIELCSNSTATKWMQIDGEGIENLL
jgi:hypothetical protein